MTNHVFIFGGPRNGSWHYHYSRCKSDPLLYGGTENLDWSGKNTRKFGDTVYSGTSFRQQKDDIFPLLQFEEVTLPGVFFENCFLQSPENFMHNIDIIERHGRKAICKGYEHTYGLSDIYDHEKVYIKRPLVDQWKSYAICHITKKWQWEEGDTMPDSEISMADTNKESVRELFLNRMTTVYNFYGLHKDLSEFTVLDYSDVLSMPNDSPLIPTPKPKLSSEVNDYIHDLSKFDNLLELEAKFF